MSDSRDLLASVDLDVYLQNKGFELLKKESSKRWRKYRNPRCGSKYLVSRNENNGQFFYNCPQKDDSYKNIFDFCREEENISGKSPQHTNFLIIKHLKAFLNQEISLEKKIYTPKKENNNFQKIEALPLTNYDYLVNIRKIDKKTIENPLVKGTIFNIPYKNNLNTAFAKRNTKGEIKGYEIYYEANGKSYALQLGDEPNYYKYLWSSNVCKEKEISHIFIAESGKDALAYLEILNLRGAFKKENFNPLLVSFGGYLSEEKETELLQLLQKSNDKKTQYFSICDNDAAGKKYDTILSKLVKNLGKALKIHIISTLPKNLFSLSFHRKIKTTSLLNLCCLFASI